jgi:hypothetical protein
MLGAARAGSAPSALLRCRSRCHAAGAAAACAAAGAAAAAGEGAAAGAGRHRRAEAQPLGQLPHQGQYRRARRPHLPRTWRALLRRDQGAPRACSVRTGRKCVVWPSQSVQGEPVRLEDCSENAGALSAVPFTTVVRQVDVPAGERWFCSTAEAQAAGWRAARP